MHVKTRYKRDYREKKTIYIEKSIDIKDVTGQRCSLRGLGKHYVNKQFGGML